MLKYQNAVMEKLRQHMGIYGNLKNRIKYLLEMKK